MTIKEFSVHFTIFFITFLLTRIIIKVRKKMIVKKCEQCEYYRRRVWSHRYYPKGYHAIGMSHAYGYCTIHEMRCISVKKCKNRKMKGGDS